MKARKKPVEIEAWQISFDFDSLSDGYNLLEWETYNLSVRNTVTDTGPKLEVWDHLHHTWISFKENDWIIKGVQGEYYPCTDEVFQETYELIPEED